MDIDTADAAELRAIVRELAESLRDAIRLFEEPSPERIHLLSRARARLAKIGEWK